MISMQPILTTSDPAAWESLAIALGLKPTEDDTQFVADGMLVIHTVERGDAADATTEWNAVVDDLDAVAAALTSVHIAHERSADVLTVTPAAGPRLTVRAAAHPPTPADSETRLSVMPIWYGSSLDRARSAYRAIGLAPRVSSDAGGWSDFAAHGGGLAALHVGDPRVELSFEYAGHLDALAEKLRDAGLPVRIVDEAYNRTLLVDAPGGVTLWVNGTIDDLYGYHRAG